MLHAVPELDLLERVLGRLASLLLGEPAVDERQFHVLQRARAGEELEALEDEADLEVPHVRQLVVGQVAHVAPR